MNYTQPLSPEAIHEIKVAIASALNREYSIFKPYRVIYNLLKNLSGFNANDFATIQDVFSIKLDLELMGYEEFSSALFFLSYAWDNLESVWSDENKSLIIDHLIKIIKDEYEEEGEFDAFVEDDILRALKKIGKGNVKAQETIEWTEKIIEEMEDEDEDDDE